MRSRNQLVFLALSALLVTVWSATKECRDPRQEFRECQSSSCVKTCENPNPIACTYDCQHGCYCKDPFVLDKSTNKCVEIEKCTKLCRENEVYEICGYCDSSCLIDPPKCAKNCQRGCYCLDGYVRYEGQCIPKENCPILEQIE